MQAVRQKRAVICRAALHLSRQWVWYSGLCTETTQIRTALMQHDLTPPAAWTQNHELSPYKTQDQRERVFLWAASSVLLQYDIVCYYLIWGLHQVTLKRCVILFSLSPFEVSDLLYRDKGSYFSSDEGWGTGTRFKMINPHVHGSIMCPRWKHDWNTTGAHNPELLPPNYMINAVLWLKTAHVQSIAALD